MLSETYPFLNKEYHQVWIKYFTKPCKLNTSAKQKTSVDIFLESFNFRSFSNEIIEKKLANSDPMTVTENNLCEIFEFDKYSFLNIVFFIRSAADSPIEISKSINKEYIDDFIMRGFIILSYKLKKLVENGINHVVDQNFPDSCWPIICEVLVAFINFKTLDKKEVYAVLEYFFSSFGNLVQIFSMNDDSIVKKSLQSILNIIIQFAYTEVQNNSFNIFNFLHSGIQTWICCLGDNKNLASFTSFANSYFEILIALLPNISIGDKKLHVAESFSILSMLISKKELKIEEISKLIANIIIFNANSINKCGIDTSACNPYFIDLINYISNSPLFSFTMNIEEPEVNNNNICSSEIFLTARAQETIHVNEYLDPIISGLQKFAERHTNIAIFYDDALIYESRLSEDKKMRFETALLLTLSRIGPVPEKEILKMIGKYIDNQEIFPDDVKKEVSGDAKMLRIALYTFIFCYVKNNPKAKYNIYEIITLFFPIKKFDKICYMLPVFRSFVLSGFVDFLESNTFSVVSQMLLNSNPSASALETETLDIIARFVATASLLKADEILENTEGFLVLTSSIFIHERYKPVYPLILAQFFSVANANRGNFEKLFSKALNQAYISLLHIAVDLSLIDVGVEINAVIYTTVKQMPNDPYVPFSKSKIIKVICQIINETHNKEMFNDLMNIIYTLCRRFPKFIELFNDSNVPVYSELKEMKNIEIDKKMIETILITLFNIKTKLNLTKEKFIESRIENPGILSVLLSLIRDTEFEESMYQFFIDICKANVVLAYQCFRANIVGIIMERLSQKVVHNALSLFALISASFFSPLTLRDIIKAISISKNPEARRQIIDSLLNLTTHRSMLPMYSFFHFDGKRTITSQKIAADSFETPFLIATALKIPKTANRQPLISLIRKNTQFIYTYIDQGILYLNITDDGIENKLKIGEIRANVWHSLFIFFEENKVKCFVNQNAVEQTIKFPEFTDDLFIYIGSFEADFFIGDIGPIFVLPAENQDLAMKNAAAALKSHSPPKDYNISYIPCNQNGEVISEVTPEGDSASSSAEPIPFTTSVCDVLKYDSTFPLVLPLFFLSTDSDFDQLPHYILLLLLNILRADPETPAFFNKVGGFHLLAGILTNLPNKKMDENIIYDLCMIFQQVDSQMKSEMIDALFLNYPLWNSKPFSLQKALYGSTVPELIQTFPSLFTEKNLDQLLYITQDDTRIEPYSFDFPEREMCVPAVLTDEERREIKELQWKIFYEIYSSVQLASTLASLFLSSVYNEKEYIRIGALVTFEKIVLLGNSTVFSLINIFNPFDALIKIFINGDFFIQNICIRCICSLGIFKNNRSVRKQLSDSIEKLTRFINKDNVSLDTLHACIALAYAKNTYTAEFVQSKGTFLIPELLLPIFKMSLYFEDRDYVPKISQTIVSHPESLKSFREMKNWLPTYLEYSKTIPFDIQPISILLSEAMKTEDHPYYMIFNYFDGEKIEQIIALLVSIGILNISNRQLGKHVIKLVCMYSSMHYNEIIIKNCINILETHVLNNPLSYFVIDGKNINVISAYANLAGFNIKNDPTTEKRVKESFKSFLDTLGNVINNSVKEFALSIIDKPDKALFMFKKYEYISEPVAAVDELHQEMYEKSYKDFVDIYKKEASNNQLHTKKIFLAFIRDIRTDGGPWSIVSTNIHWKYTTRTDTGGRIVFLTRNLNFDDHKKASAARDSMPVESDEGTGIQLRKITSLSAMFGMTQTTQKTITSFSATCRKLSGFYDGDIYVYADRIAFNGVMVSDTYGAPLPATEGASKGTTKFIEIPFNSLCFVFKRYYMHQDCGCEIFTAHWISTLFYFKSTQQRDEFLKTISSSCSGTRISDIDKIMVTFRKACNGNVQDCDAQELLKKTKFEEMWANGNLSNYHYLFLLNIISGRSLNDISQYPIYPWVIADYKSKTFDVMNPSFFRDFSKPVGALNEERLAQNKILLETIEDPLQKCLYRSNMSNPSCVVGYMIRSEPFTTLHIKLQDGKFDHPNRLFYSIGAAWNSVNTTAGDYRELIPQFFCSQYFLMNSNKFDLGSRQSDAVIDDVILPPWAKDSFDFITKHRVALESDYVSEHLTEWIDLTFGPYQNSIEHNNVYHFFSYHESVNYQLDETQTMLLQDHCANFGCLPTKLLTSPHSKKAKAIPYSLSSATFPQLAPDESVSTVKKDCIITTKGRIMYDRSNRIEERQLKLETSENAQFLVINTNLLLVHYPQKSFLSIYSVEKNEFVGKIAHQSSVIDCVAVIGAAYIVTGGSDCVLYIWNTTHFKLIGTMQVHSAQIQCISGIKSLDICVSVDTDHQAIIISPSERKIRHSFKIENCPQNATHKVHVASTEQIIISSYSATETKSSVAIYNTIGEALKVVEFTCGITKIESSLVNKAEDVIIVALANGRVVLLNSPSIGGEWLTKQQIKELTENAKPETICICGEKRKIIYSTTANEIRSFLF